MNYLSATARKVTVFAVGAVAGLFFLSGCGQVITLIPTSTPVAEPAATFSPPSSPTPVPTATPAPFTPPPTATMTATPEPTIYLVAPGDTLGRIAEQYGITVAALQEENNILDPRTLQQGQQLVIPYRVSVDGGAAGARPTPTPIPFAHQKIHFSFTPLGGLWVLGEVENTSTFTLEQVQIGVKLLDADQNALAEEQGFVLLNLVDPGGVAPFAILFEKAPKEFASYQIFPLGGVPAYEGGYYRDLVVEDLTFEGELYSSYNVTGSVRNTGQDESIEVQVILTAYDSLDRIIAARTVAPEHNVIAANGVTSFAAILVPLGGPVERIHAVAQGRRYPTGN
ncbi:MAG: FxLYD domain-containing protein [Caldilineaceae bacterium]|nr:FxLYD domain-containing protein [Caldilineaceae bacterium]